MKLKQIFRKSYNRWIRPVFFRCNEVMQMINEFCFIEIGCGKVLLAKW